MSALCMAAHATQPAFAGISIEQAIRQLETRGLAVIYSTDLVTPDLRVTAEPRATEPLAMLREILAPHALELASGPNGRWMIVRMDTRAMALDYLAAYRSLMEAAEPRIKLVSSAE